MDSQRKKKNRATWRWAARQPNYALTAQKTAGRAVFYRPGRSELRLAKLVRTLANDLSGRAPQNGHRAPPAPQISGRSILRKVPPKVQKGQRICLVCEVLIRIGPSHCRWCHDPPLLLNLFLEPGYAPHLGARGTDWPILTFAATCLVRNPTPAHPHNGGIPRNHRRQRHPWLRPSCDNSLRVSATHSTPAFFQSSPKRIIFPFSPDTFAHQFPNTHLANLPPY